jgi:hypothetical protein
MASTGMCCIAAHGLGKATSLWGLYHTVLLLLHSIAPQQHWPSRYCRKVPPIERLKRRYAEFQNRLVQNIQKVVDNSDFAGMQLKVIAAGSMFGCTT